MSTSWLPEGFVHPLRVDVTDGFHMRPIRATDVDIDLPVINRNRAQLWRMYGEIWGWPSRELTRQEDLDDLARHEREASEHLSFNYAILTTSEDRLLGCVYIDPLDPARDHTGAPRAHVSWWLDVEAPDHLRQAVDDLVPRWIETAWPFAEVETPCQHLWSPEP